MGERVECSRTQSVAVSCQFLNDAYAEATDCRDPVTVTSPGRRVERATATLKSAVTLTAIIQAIRWRFIVIFLKASLTIRSLRDKKERQRRELRGDGKCDQESK
jgi:hypothetical protein